MKKNLLLSAAFFALIFASCKKENSSPKTSTALQQIEQLVAKYPNLKLVTNITTGSALNTNAIKAMDDSLSAFSNLLKRIQTLSRGTSTISLKPSPSNSNITENSIRPKSIDDYSITYGQYGWSAIMSVGSSELGYYPIYYSAVIQYDTDNSTGTFLNYINNVFPMTSSASPSSGEYNFIYTPGGTSFSISSDKHTVQLSFSGKANFSHVVGGVTVASLSNYQISNGGPVSSSSLPLVYTPQN